MVTYSDTIFGLIIGSEYGNLIFTIIWSYSVYTIRPEYGDCIFGCTALAQNMVTAYSGAHIGSEYGKNMLTVCLKALQQ